MFSNRVNESHLATIEVETLKFFFSFILLSSIPDVQLFIDVLFVIIIYGGLYCFNCVLQ